MFLIFSVINSILLGQKQRGQKPIHRKQNQMAPINKNIINKIRNELELSQEVEGITFEDRSKEGSLNYVDIYSSQEGIQTEPADQNLFVKYENTEESESGVEDDFDFRDIQRSIVLAEILGPPRVLKRKVR